MRDCRRLARGYARVHCRADQDIRKDGHSAFHVVVHRLSVNARGPAVRGTGEAGAGMSDRPRVLFCCNATVKRDYLTGEGVARLERLAGWEWLPSEGTSNRPGVWGGPSEDPDEVQRLQQKIAEGFDALVVCHGSPYIDAAVLDRSPGVRFIGELEGDRFANRIDVDAAYE